jgi:hypothetical protein
MNFAHPEPGDWNSYLQRFMDGKSQWKTYQSKVYTHNPI